MIIKSIISILMFLMFCHIEYAFPSITQIWAKRYSLSSNSLDIPKSIVTDNYGNIYVIGSSGSNSNIDIVTIKYLPTGEQDWLRLYNGPGNNNDIAMGAKLDSEGNIIVIGDSEGTESGRDFVIIKYLSSGQKVWEKRYSSIGDNDDFPSSIAIDKLNNILVTGRGFQNFVTVKYNSFGVQQWISIYPTLNSDDIAYDIEVDKLGNVYIAGEYSGDCITIKYDSTGIQQWVSLYNGSGNGSDFINSISLDSIGNLFVSGSSIENTSPFGGFLTIKYNQLGVQQWVRFYEGTGNFFSVGKSMKVSKNGNIYVTGYSTESGQGYNFTTIKYNTYGDTLWKASYHNGSNDIAFAMDIDNSDNVYITGESDGNGTGDDYATVKYDSTGNQLWVMRYDYSGQFGDFANSIAVDYNGNVYVTGGSDRDILTIKYSDLTGLITINSEIPKDFSLSQNYPNPFNPKTVISYEIRITSDAELKVFDVLGNEVAELVNEKQNAGSYSVEFDGSGFASGIYFYSLIIDGVIIDTKRMILLK
ncbi:MAG: SBBP repeat-containing protein [Ignavibacteria bacterium]|nr:SBBP repeat-containing protein [Ignavibacteria bacterium]